MQIDVRGDDDIQLQKKYEQQLNTHCAHLTYLALCQTHGAVMGVVLRYFWVKRLVSDCSLAVDSVTDGFAVIKMARDR